MARVGPDPGSPRESGVLSLQSMSPDFNGDGVVDATEQDVYDKMMAADVDGDGYLTRTEVYQVIASSQRAIEEAQKGGIAITSLNPDSDGDGKVEKWEVEVYNRIKDADADKSGSISVKELFGVIKGAAESDRQKRLFRRLFGVAVLIILALIGAMLGMGLVAGEAVKESHVPDCSDPSNADAARCASGKIVRAGQVESFYDSIFDLCKVPTEQLAYMRDITCYVDMTAAAGVGGAVEATFKIAGAYKRSNDACTLVTTNGYSISLNTAAQSGSIVMDGSTYPITTTAPASGRRLETADTPMAETISGKELATKHLERRKLSFAGERQLGFSGERELSFHGERQLSFQGASVDGWPHARLPSLLDARVRVMLAGALMTSGSFTMMAATSFS